MEEKYELPFHTSTSMSGKNIAKYILIDLMLWAFTALFFLAIAKDNPVMGILFGIFMGIIALIIAYTVIDYGILKRHYFELTKEGITYKGMKEIKVRWNEINDINFVVSNKSLFLNILLSKDVKKKQKKTYLNMINSELGGSPGSYRIPMYLLNDVDLDKLVSTIGYEMERSTEEGANYVDSSSELDDESTGENLSEDNLFKAFIYSLLLCIFLGAFYGICIRFLKVNFVFLPIISSWLIVVMFKRYHSASKTLPVRLYLGVICVFQILLGVTIEIMLEFSTLNVIEASKAAIIVLSRFNSKGSIAIVVVAVLSFLIGAVDKDIAFK